LAVENGNMGDDPSVLPLPVTQDVWSCDFQASAAPDSYL